MSAEINSLITAFTFIFLAELGDKTQITTIVFSSKSSAISVFSGAMLAFFLVDGLSAIIGGKLINFIDYKWINLIAGLIFIFLGFLSFFSKNEKINLENQKISFFNTFFIVSLMELGDKTQITTIILAAKLCSPIIVLIGIMLAFSIITGIGIIFGVKILRLLPRKYLKILTFILFITFGSFSIFNIL
ncbi:MAG: TMEM165/GDT1 family protein [Nitrososphaerota archaeon]